MQNVATAAVFFCFYSLFLQMQELCQKCKRLIINDNGERLLFIIGQCVRFRAQKFCVLCGSLFFCRRTLT